MKTTIRISFFLLFLLGFYLPKTAAQTLASQKKTTTKEIPATVNRTLILQLVNEVRKKGCQCGDTYYYPAPAVTWQAQLEEAAYKHSADMVKKKFFSHYAPDGSRGGVRLQRVGYAWKTYGENIGQGYKTEKEMLKGWLNSPGHCKNIMSKSFKEMGVARVGNLWTQEFGSR